MTEAEEVNGAILHRYMELREFHTLVTARVADDKTSDAELGRLVRIIARNYSTPAGETLTTRASRRKAR